MADEVGSRLYCCYSCRNNVAQHDDLVSKGFYARSGRAFLFSHAMNIVLGVEEDTFLITGLHTTAAVSCSGCNETLGWKYIKAFEEPQKYKEGKVLLEVSKIRASEFPTEELLEAKSGELGPIGPCPRVEPPRLPSELREA